MIPDSRRTELERHLLEALRATPVPDPQRLMAPGVQEGLQQLFLEQADALLQPLLTALSEWQEGQRTGPGEEAVRGLKRLAGLAQDRRLPAIQTVAEALGHALPRVQPGAGRPGVSDCLQGAEELARLLFLYAAGQVRDANAQVLDQLRLTTA